MVLRLDIIAPLVLNALHIVCSERILSCNVTWLEPCPGAHQICNQTSNECHCIEGYVRDGDKCESPYEIDPSSRDITAAVVTIFTLVLLACGLVLVVRKYNLLEYARQKMNTRRNNDVIYEDLMIGHDDPPLSP